VARSPNCITAMIARQIMRPSPFYPLGEDNAASPRMEPARFTIST
jgi:hypothetical protein